MKKFEIPTIFVIFGITGDLFRSKILDSLHNLYSKDLLPKKSIIYGFGRREWQDNDLRTYLESLMKKQRIRREKDFLNKFFYAKGTFENLESYKELSNKIGRTDNEWKFCSNKLFYLAVPPNEYKTIVVNLDKSGLTEPCSEKEGWTRVILEKPFGTDLQSAKELDTLLVKLFKEEQIYRVDHYLAKETVRNIIAFRFSNTLLEPALNNKYLKSIKVKILEKDTIENRGNFYDGVGALRDIGQNHALQLLSLFTMENPKEFSCYPIRRNRAKQMAYLKLLGNIEESTNRAQYIGYLREKGVQNSSKTETYFKIKGTFTNGKFKDVPVYIEGGKALEKDRTYIEMKFKRAEPCICPVDKGYTNSLRYEIKPREEIEMDFLIKKSGYKFVVKKETFEFGYEKKINRKDYIPEYEQLLMDIIKGDQTLFVSTEEVMNQWKFAEPILKAWEQGKLGLIKYKIGTTPKVKF